MHHFSLRLCLSKHMHWFRSWCASVGSMFMSSCQQASSALMVVIPLASANSLQISARLWGMFGDETSVILLIKFVCVRKLLKVFIHETVQKSLALQKTKNLQQRRPVHANDVSLYSVTKRFLQTLVVGDDLYHAWIMYTDCPQCSQVHRLDATWIVGLRASPTKDSTQQFSSEQQAVEEDLVLYKSWAPLSVVCILHTGIT